LKKAESEYKRLLRAMPKGDASPYLFYLAALDRLGQRATMADVIQELLETNVSNQELVVMLNELYAESL